LVIDVVAVAGTIYYVCRSLCANIIGFVLDVEKAA